MSRLAYDLRLKTLDSAHELARPIIEQLILLCNTAAAEGINSITINNSNLEKPAVKERIQDYFRDEGLTVTFSIKEEKSFSSCQYVKYLVTLSW